MAKETWISGPLELIEHAGSHIKEGKEFDLRIALISIDNAVEISIKIYLIINRRSIGVSRKDFNKAKNSFPTLLDLLWDYSPDKTSESDLDAIEYYHKLRNNLYHEPVGITTNKKIVELYYTIAKNLIVNLFDIKEEDYKEIKLSDLNEKFEDFLQIWNKIQSNLNNYALTQGLIPKISKPYTISKILAVLVKNDNLPSDFAEEILSIYKIRNQMVHSQREFTMESLDKSIKDLKKVDNDLIQLMNN